MAKLEECGLVAGSRKCQKLKGHRSKKGCPSLECTGRDIPDHKKDRRQQGERFFAKRV
jgi:hypothetical protein